ncbi:alpha/beta fold hydrolase [Celeribacter litoreus]|uniref:alpha/beta fold hydrolase n=1 Tax=Celeribacter litoreus TaxID=2876714 RepID=UPI001CCE2C56|nr:alpha/beta hydrolase [Celeribacter litoreus]MCA0044962.1 alpha/beta hydrolase [Celeribacter litoreus]
MTKDTRIPTALPSKAFKRFVEGYQDHVIEWVHPVGKTIDPSLGQTFHSLRERFQAVTDVGLSPVTKGLIRPENGLLPAHADQPDLRYTFAGDGTTQSVLFIHGSPGQASDWSHFLSVTPESQTRIAVDRPGFGGSDPHRPYRQLSDQAAAIARLIAERNRPTVLVGSSFGGPVALRLAADHPDLVNGVVLVGAAADPALEKVHILQRIAHTPWVKRLLPQHLIHSNTELLTLREELDLLGERMEHIEAPVSILQGLHDTLVPPENATYLMKRLTGTKKRRVIMVENAGHFLHILTPQVVENTLDDILNDV